MSAVLISRETVTADNYGPAVSVVTWILVVSAVLGVLLKVGLGISARVPIGSDDATLIFATVLSIAQSITVSIQIPNGVGRHRESLTGAQLDRFEKAEYAASLLFIASLASSKISILVLLRRITPISSHRRLTLAMGVFIATWSVASLFASAFRCTLPTAWKVLHNQCFNQISFSVSYASLNLITEVALIGIPTYIVWNVHISRRRKYVVIGCFGARLAVIGPIIAQVIQLNGLRSTTDITFDSWPYYISNQLVLNLSLLTVCVPSIKNFLIGLESGMIQTGDFRLRKSGTTTAASNSTNPTSSNNNHPSLRLHTLANANNEDASPVVVADGEPPHDRRSINGDTVGSRLPSDASTVASVESSSENPNWGDSPSSESKIVRTTEWRVEFQPQGKAI